MLRILITRTAAKDSMWLVDERTKVAVNRLDKREQGSFSFGGTFAAVTQKTVTWHFVLAPITLIYLYAALWVAWNIHPISRLLDLSKNRADSLLLDLCFVSLPLIGAIAKYLSSLK